MRKSLIAPIVSWFGKGRVDHFGKPIALQYSPNRTRPALEVIISSVGASLKFKKPCGIISSPSGKPQKGSPNGDTLLAAFSPILRYFLLCFGFSISGFG